MMQTDTNSTVLPLGVLETIAARVRANGLYLLVVRANGSILFSDGSAEPFFQKYVLPVVQQLANSARLLQDVSGPGVTVIRAIPGVLLAAVPYIERRQLNGVLVLAGKDTTFNADDAAGQMPANVLIDPSWLKQQADQLPAFTEETISRNGRLLATMVRDQTRLAGLETELTHLSGQLANTYEELSLIYQISGGMRVNRKPAVFFKQTCLDAIEVMGVRGLGVALHNAQELGQEPAVFGPIDLAAPPVQRLASDLLVWMRQRKSPLLINDLSKDARLLWLSEHARRLLAVPLQRGEEVLGVLFALDKETGDFDSVDSKLLNSIANESAIYLENAVLFEDVHGLMMGLLHSLTSAVDAKDAYTCGHSERVAVMSKMIAQSAGLDEHQVERIYMAGLLHDVGKIGVPEAILQKPGRLTPEEFDLMKRHPAIGAHILHDVKQIKDIIPGVLYHHEKFDGKGYPDGLAGRDIPLMGRIICLADCFDAMTSTRTYRKALPLEVALAEIRRCSGTQFDPALTEAFLNIGAENLRETLRQQEASSNRLRLPTSVTAAAVEVAGEKAA